VNLTIHSDSNKIRQVLTNLISNAVKYTHEGTVEVGFELHKGSIEFYVKDTGIGISEEEQNRIFDTFYRSKRVLSSAIRGTGLGLNIAKELVSLMGGTIGVSSVLDKGSRFYFTIPVEQTVEEQIVNVLPQIARQNVADLTILVADDESVNFQLIKILLKGKVKRVDHAANGKEAVELVAQNKYNLILMDLKMPVMGGIEATKILRKKYPDLPIIAQTAFTLPEDKKVALQAGCNDFISKPLRKEHLMEIMNKYS
jgi:CheY-like chemotaxis protein